jgi:MFS transporter, MHS family, proline/betaine transporter
MSAHTRARLASMVGNALEWYDFAIYGYFAATLGKHFFPSEDPAVSVIAAFGVFAIGFLARPVGSIIFGNLGDRVGRRRVLIVSIVVMAVPTTLVGFLPTYAEIGPWAPALLIVLRLLQGLSVGGEMTGSITFMIESASPNRRGLAGSWAYVGVGTGFLLGSAVGSAVTGLLSQAAVDSWGWRIPFLLGSVIAICGYLIRRQGINETYRPADSNVAWYKGPLRLAFTKYGKQLVQAIGLSAYIAGGFYLIFTYLTTYLVTVVGEPETDVFDINSINMVVYAGMSLVGGLLGDRLGFRWVLLTLAAAGLLLAWPLFWLIDHPNIVLSFLGEFVFALIVAPYAGLFATTMALLFPPTVRMSGFSISFNVGFAVLGGTAPLAASYLIDRGHGDLSPAYVMMLSAAISIVAICWAWRDLPHLTKARATGPA